MSAAIALTDYDPEPRAETAAFVLSLRARGISDLRLLRAMETVPRDVFAPRRYADLARHDVALPLPCGETMTAPSAVALMLMALGIRAGDRVLEIGTGSGYVTALMRALGAVVHSCERRPVLADSAWERLKAVGLADDCELFCCDGFAAGPGEGRYDRVILNGTFASGRIPPAVTSRLVIHGRLVCGRLGEHGQAQIATVSRQDDGELAMHSGAPIRLSRLLVNEAAAGSTEA